MTTEAIDAIRELHRERCFAIEQRKRLDLALGAYFRIKLGWSRELPEAERKRIAKEAADLIALGEHQVVRASLSAREPFDDIESVVSKRMGQLAQELPVWQSFGETIRGFGPLSLAIIVGEAGDLSNYATEAKLWKRMGVAVIDGMRQGSVPKGLSKEDAKAAWKERKYSPVRRSRLWTIGDSLIKGNRGGKYRSIYLARKELEASKFPEQSKMFHHRRAQRYMEKRLLRDLWKAWRRTREALSERPNSECPPPELLAA